jgi:hypothetical protein
MARLGLVVAISLSVAVAALWTIDIISSPFGPCIQPQIVRQTRKCRKRRSQKRGLSRTSLDGARWLEIVESRHGFKGADRSD